MTHGGSNRGRGSVKRSREKGPMDHFFIPIAEAVVQNRSGKMTQTTMNDAYKKEARKELVLLFQDGCMMLSFHLMRPRIQVSNP